MAETRPRKANETVHSRLRCEDGPSHRSREIPSARDMELFGQRPRDDDDRYHPLISRGRWAREPLLERAESNSDDCSDARPALRLVFCI